MQDYMKITENGPFKLTQDLGIDLDTNYHPLTTMNKGGSN